MGMRRVEGMFDRHNEVWAGKPVNMAAKLASTATSDQLIASERFYSGIRKDRRATHSCGCSGGEYTAPVVIRGGSRRRGPR